MENFGDPRSEKPARRAADLPEQHSIFSRNIVAIYTVMAILIRMKETLGLEAMVDYIHTYHDSVGTNHPDMKNAVAKALSLMSIEKIYREAAAQKP